MDLLKTQKTAHFQQGLQTSDNWALDFDLSITVKMRQPSKMSKAMKVPSKRCSLQKIIRRIALVPFSIYSKGYSAGTTVTNGQRYWMPMLLNCFEKGFLIPKRQNPLKKTYFPKEAIEHLMSAL